MNINHAAFDKPSLHELFNFIKSNKTELLQAQKLIKQKIKKHYPFMKILDNVFWAKWL